MSEPTSEAIETRSAIVLEKMDDNKAFAFASIIRQMICNENDLTNQRLTWMTTLNGLMLTGSSLVWGKSANRLVIYMICFVGVIINFSSFVSLYYSQRARDKLLKIWKKRSPYPSELCIIPPVIGYPPTNNIFIRNCLPWKLLPWTFIIFWIVLLFVVRFRSYAGGFLCVGFL